MATTKRGAVLRRAVLFLLVIGMLLSEAALPAQAYVYMGPYGHSLTDSGFAEFSRGDNVVVVVVDRLDYDYIVDGLKEDKHLLDFFDGFTMYEDAVSGYARTAPALLHMFTGADKLLYQVDFKTALREAWTYGGRNLLADVTAADYSVEVYTNMDYLFSDMDYVGRYVKNYYNRWMEPKTPVGPADFRMEATWQGNLRWFGPEMRSIYPDNRVELDIEPQPLTPGQTYQFNDHYDYSLLAEATADRWEKSFKIFHFHGAHEPYRMLANGQVLDEPSNPQEQTRGNFLHLSNFFARLKELQVYDRSTIIVTADHGYAVNDYSGIQKATRVGLFYKPAGAKGKLKRSSAPVTTADIPATVLKAMGADYSAYGLALDEVTSKNRQIRMYYKTASDIDTDEERQLFTYEIRGKASKLKNWVEIRSTPILYPYNN